MEEESKSEKNKIVIDFKKEFLKSFTFFFKTN